MQYDLELKKVNKLIKDNAAKKVLIQLPDGLKPKAKEVLDYLKKKTDAEIFIYGGSCFGACDVPNAKDFDLIIQFGHARLN
jgi:2-(3-amino-3-carboxypropyl)histidine synthase